MNLDGLASRLTATYHRWLTGEATQADFIAAAAAYTEALESRRGGFWQRLEDGPFSLPSKSTTPTRAEK